MNPLTKEQEAWLEGAAGFARHMLKDSKGFGPYASGMDADGQGQLIGLAPEEGEPLPPVEVVEIAKNALRQMIGDQGLVAVAYFFDGRITDAKGAKTDAVLGHIETADGKSLDYILPYKVGFLKRITFSEAALVPAERSLYPAE